MDREKSGLVVGLGISVAVDTNEAVAEAASAALISLEDPPKLAIVTSTVDHDARQVFSALRERLGPDVQIHGATTSLGVLSSSGVVMGAGAFAVLLLGGDVQVQCVSAALGEHDPQSTARALAEQLKKGGDPAVVFMHATPGPEEDVLRGLRGVLGDELQLLGGTAADHAIASEWSVFTNDGPVNNGVSLAALYGDIRVGAHFLSPYKPTGERVKVTEASGRTLVTLGGRPAAEVLGDWVGDSISSAIESEGVVLAQTALKPFGIQRGDEFTTIHPASIGPGGTVNVFAVAATGTELCGMQSTPEILIQALAALRDKALKTCEAPQAALLIYCAGCAGAVGETLDEGLRQMWAEMGDVPLLGMCCFGEQGTLPGIGPVHANLSLGLVLLG